MFQRRPPDWGRPSLDFPSRSHMISGNFKFLLCEEFPELTIVTTLGACAPCIKERTKGLTECPCVRATCVPGTEARTRERQSLCPRTRHEGSGVGGRVRTDGIGRVNAFLCKLSEHIQPCGRSGRLPALEGRTLGLELPRACARPASPLSVPRGRRWARVCTEVHFSDDSLGTWDVTVPEALPALGRNWILKSTRGALTAATGNVAPWGAGPRRPGTEHDSGR